MKKSIVWILAASALAGTLATGCSYAGATGVGTDKVVIARNDNFLFGILRKVVVCKVGAGGVTACADNESP